VPGKRRRAKKPLTPVGRNPYVVATRRLGHKVRPSVKRYSRKGRQPPDEREEP
jgi:hypothetical protein